MKMNYKMIAALAAVAVTTACADQDIDNVEVKKPASLEAVETMNAYGNIKEYVNREAAPNFKIGCALGAADYNERGIVYRVANRNFDELTTGNAMKYASVVGDDGSMNFNTIKDFLDNTEEAGVSVYGHTLAWHAQQNLTWLNSLLADISVEIKPEDFTEDKSLDFADYTSFPNTVVDNYTPEVKDGKMIAKFEDLGSKKRTVNLLENIPTEVGKEYELQMEINTDVEVQVPLMIGTTKAYFKSAGNWEDKIIKFTATSTSTTVYIESKRLEYLFELTHIVVGHYPPSSRPLTQEEKVQNLSDEMGRWCNGMMEACAGRVKAWDMINEAISGEGNVHGYYDLQHGSASNNTDFFWQDVLGSENYGPVVSKAAREAFKANGGNEADLKLFVNDYNLESDWDDNHKLKSLIYWVGVWENNGAKIDGLSSQMHISYYEDKAIMKSKADHYVKMLKLMAETGKLVRISELDMGYVDIYGNDVATTDLTPEQHQNMANYYKFIIKMFLKIVPANQQYGICQWCLTDAPSSSGWRANSPVGLWTEDWTRKAAYAAFCEAFENPAIETEDFFKFLENEGLEHYVSPF